MRCSILIDHIVQLEKLNKCLCTQALSEIEATIQSQTKMGNTCFTEYHRPFLKEKVSGTCRGKMYREGTRGTEIIK